MNNSIHTVFLDVQARDSQDTLYFKQGDTAREIRFVLREGAQDYTISEDCTIAFSAVTSDGSKVFQPCKNTDGVIIYGVASEVTCVAGTVECELVLYGSEGRVLASPRFTLVIEERLVLDGEIEPPSDYETWADYAKKAETAAESAEKSKNEATDAATAAVNAKADIEDIAAEGEGIKAKVNKNTADILTHSNLIDANTKSIVNLQGYLGYDDKDILGLEADFESNTFTRLAGAKGLNAGADFNQFSMYRDRVRCNVADDGKINAICGSGEIVPLCDFQEVEIYEGSPPNPETGDEEDVGGNFSIDLTTTPHPTDSGSNIKIYVDNVTTGESYVLNSILGDVNAEADENQIFGTFKLSDGSDCTLTGWAGRDWNGSYESYFQFFTYPYTTDTLKIKVELERSEYRDDGSNGQVMVYQPKFYYRVVPTKLEKIENGFGYHIRKANYYVSSKPKPFFKLHPAFYDKNGNPVEYILYGAYEGNVDGGKLCSVVGVEPTAPYGAEAFENFAKSRGDGWHIETIQAVSVNQLLFAIEYGTFDSQDAIGRGVADVSSRCTTGSTAFLGNTSGAALETTYYTNGTRTVLRGNGKVAVSYRGVENLWGNLYTCVGGANIWGDGGMLGGQLYVCEDFDFALNRREENYLPVGFLLPSPPTQFISTFGYGNEKFDWLFAPSSLGGTSLLPIGDRYYTASNISGYGGFAHGGRYDSADGAGLFMCRTYSTASGSTDVCARLIYIPTAK